MRTSSRCAFVLLLALAPLSPSLTAQASSSGFGPGMVLTRVGKEIWIDAVTPNGPAAVAGLRVGDHMWAIEDTPVSFMTEAVANALLLGARNSAVRVTITGTAVRTVTLKRSVPVRGEVNPAESPASKPIAEAMTQRPATQSRVTQPQATQSAGNKSSVTFDRWVEPREHSFSIDVPRGWTVSGGLTWVGPLEPQMGLEVRSPNGDRQIFIGDQELTTRQDPPFGAREGTVYRTGTGDPVTFQRYVTGSEFAKYEVATRRCKNPQWVSASDDPETSQRMTDKIQPQAAAMNLNALASAGNAGFMCGTMQGYASAVTVAVSQGRQKAWFVEDLGVFLSADPMRSMETRYVLEHMLSTMKIDDGWQKTQDERAATATQSALMLQNARFEAQQSAYRSASTTLNRMNHPMGDVGTRRSSSPRDVVRDTERMCDAMDRCSTVTNDGTPVFIDHSGRVMHGTPSGSPPDNTGVWSPMYHQ